jgi:hypothetical protein
MADCQGITLYTSIPPRLKRMAAGREYGDEYQKKCIDSWISGGFRVVSINPKSEIASLESKYPQVTYVDSGSEDIGTEIHVFFQNIEATEERFAGIINADCFLLNSFSIAERLQTDSQESVVLLRP